MQDIRDWPPDAARAKVDPSQDSMTTQEIQQYIDNAVSSNFEGYTSESGEMMTSAGGDGRFSGKVLATRYSDLPTIGDVYLAIGLTDKQLQIVKLGKSECLNPSEVELDFMLLKELGIKPDGEGC